MAEGPYFIKKRNSREYGSNVIIPVGEIYLKCDKLDVPRILESKFLVKIITVGDKARLGSKDGNWSHN